ncbi:MAG: hypothetical protein A2040_08340, partial [Rhodocyclales bacterium GWA2_65_19]
ADSLRAKVRCDDARWAAVLDEWLAGVAVADDLSGRIASASGPVVSREGHVLSKHGLTLYVPDVRTHGVIERQREIEELAAAIEHHEQEELAAREGQEQAEHLLTETQAQLVEARRAAEEGQQRLHAAQVEALKLTQAQARYDERAGQIDRDLDEIVKAEETERGEFTRAEAEATRCREQLDAVRERLEQALELQRSRDAALRETRALEHQLAREAQEAGFSERECISKLDDNARAAETAKTQLARVAAETDAAKTEIAAISDAVLQEQLQSALSSRQGREGLLAERRNALEAAAAELRGFDEQRMKLEQGLQPAREKINDWKLKQQAAQLNEEQFRERLAEAGIASEEDEAALAAELVPGLKESALQGDIARLNAEIEALGPVNLAALEELTVARERKGYLDEQATDLVTAINTLEDAIRRIDRETREQLQETYDTVNGHFGTLFPLLFGGGEAKHLLTETQAQLVEARRAAEEGQQRLHAAQVEALKLTQAQARYDERAGQIDRDLDEIVKAEETERGEFTRAEAEATRCREQLDAVRERLEQALELQRSRDAALRETRALEHQLAREAQEAGFSERECISKLDDNARAAETAKTQLARVAAETDAAKTEIAAISDAVLQEQLQSALSSRQGREGLLAERRNALEAAAAELRGFDEQRMKLEQGLQPAREKINDWKLKQQAAQLNEEQFRERLAEAGIASEEDEAALAAELVPGLKESALQGDIARLNAEIEALGPVNLAALEELTVARERKGYLDEQATDLVTAINTLEDAIRRIDRETREQLQETYDTVNGHFGTLFPLLFGGGEAKLLLTGEEILDAGIQIMAQPPGKKNATIHLLSGGEKALTAIALVFAMFQLNPAPFCMLDEVDAPLDDSNTVRFCELVKRMSQQTQFVFITHNKIAMEMAQQLIGVTMQERGVSRVVEVDIEEALRMTVKEAA